MVVILVNAPALNQILCRRKRRRPAGTTHIEPIKCRQRQYLLFSNNSALKIVPNPTTGAYSSPDARSCVFCQTLYASLES